MKKAILYIVFFFFIFLHSASAVTPNSLFTDHMVLQKGVTIPVWGIADNGESVTVEFNGAKVSTIARKGHWMVKLPSMNYLKKPSTMVIQGKNKVTIQDVVVGEVWLCSGQSNMERQLGPRPPQPLINNWKTERDSANYPLIREFFVPHKYSSTKVEDADSKWVVCTQQTVIDFSAVGYLFAKKLYLNLKVPIGILFSAYGGTPAEDWTSKAALENNSELTELVNKYDSVMNAHWHPQGEIMSGLYNGMIYPLIPFALKGVCWYQGEQNNYRPEQYKTVLINMINNWRTDFKQKNLPFLIVQIAPYKDLSPELRESQRMVSQMVKNTALIVTTDCGDSINIHPANKQPIGCRLSLAARAIAYGQKIEYSGPVIRYCKRRNDQIEVHFTHTGERLVVDGGLVRGFEIAGQDNIFHPTSAFLMKDAIVVYNPAVKNPRALRFGWHNVPDTNLFNSEGLPAGPFMIYVF